MITPTATIIKPICRLAEISSLLNQLTNSSNLDGANANTNPSRTATHPKMVTISETTITHPSSYQTSNNRRIHYLAKLPK